VRAGLKIKKGVWRMEFTMSDEQKIFKRTVREYCQKNVEPRARKLLLISDGARWISDIAGC